MHEVLAKRLGGLSLPRKRVVRLTDRPDMTLDVYHGHKTTTTTTILPCVKYLVYRRAPCVKYLVYGRADCEYNEHK